MRALLDARSRRGGSFVALEEPDRQLTYNDLVRAAFALGRLVSAGTAKREKIGVLLPTGAGAVIALFAISAAGRTPAMLNFTSGARNLRAACQAGDVNRIVTARRFADEGGYAGLINELGAFAKILYLDELRDHLTTRDKVRAALGGLAPWAVRSFQNPEETAVLLFTSGTEGDPKGVALSHTNLFANVLQVRGHIPELVDSDIMFNPLPMFHCYGLTAGALLPLLSGFRAVLHPSPLHVKDIPKRVRDTGATLLVGTDTFVTQYARGGEPGDLDALRYAVCGAERVRDETRGLLRRTYNVEMLEGYGATEAAPIIAVNSPSDNRPGTVGQFLPGMEYRLEPVEGLSNAGRLFVRGPNVMKGYIRPSSPGVIEPLHEGWHDTGDVVRVDEDGFVHILGRLKRFAKIGGEMISLAVVENCATSLWPERMHAAMALPDPRKGEQILLVTDGPDVNRAEILAFAQNHGVPELAVPRKVFLVDAVPVLGTGKIDYGGVARLIEELGVEAA